MEKSKKSAVGLVVILMLSGGGNATVSSDISVKDVVFSRLITGQDNAYKTGLYGLENG